MRIRIVLAWGVLLVFGLLVNVSARAQVTGATLAGTVTDSSGAVIAGAQVSVRNIATGLTKDSTADSAGFYSVPNLPAGAYEVKVSAMGFATAVQSNIALGVGAQQQFNVSMKVGETSQTVEVTESAPQVQLTSSTLSSEVQSQTVRELPLNGRDWTSLAALQPGVNTIENQTDFQTAQRGNRGFGAELNISGGRTTFNNYRIDGISINDYANATPGNVTGATLGVDAIQEFSVLMGSFPAEYGKASGGVINAITKSGTNGFHGDVYEFLRNSAMDSRDYFTRSAGILKPEFRRNQFGASAGGPIIKDRTFIFGDFEGLRQVKGITTSVTVPSDTARGGTLQYTNTPPAGCTAISPTQCTVTVDPAATAMLAMFPLANAAISGDKGQFINTGIQNVPENLYTVRLDHKISSKDSLFGTYLFDDTNYTQPDSFNNDIFNSHTRRQTVALEETHTFGSSWVNAARFGFNRSHVINLQPAGAINPAANDVSLGSMPGETASRIFIQAGFSAMPGGVGSGAYYYHNWNNYELYDDAFWTHGTHTIKFGGGMERMQYNFIAFQNLGGRWNFGGLQNFLTNKPTHFEAGLPSTVQPREIRQTLVAGYIQDDWRFRPNLSLNFGVRYEMATVPNDAQGRITNLRNLTEPLAAAGTTVDPNLRCGSMFTAQVTAQIGYACGSVGPYFSNPTVRNFEPRLGFAWDPFRNGKTSVRGGFGIYDVLPLPGYFLLQQNQAAPFLIFKGTTASPPAGSFSAGGNAVLSGPVGLLSTSVTEQNPHRNYVMQWNLNVQRQLTQDLTLTVGYVGSHGVHLLLRGDDGDMVLPVGKINGSLLFPLSGTGTPVNPNYSSIRYIYWGTDSFYDALNVNLQKQLSHGFQIQLAYSWAKSIDDNSSTIAGNTFAHSLNSLFWFAPQAMRGLSDFNVGQSLTLNGLWDVPTPASLRGIGKAALGGWELGSIFHLNNGIPTTAIISGDPMGLKNNGADQFGIPNRVPGCDPINHNFIGSPAPVYLNLSCFTLPTAPVADAAQCTNFSGAATPAPSGTVYCANLLGNAGRNTIIGPKLVNLDFSVFKNFQVTKISESFKVQFRAEFFNILNRSNFVPPEPLNGGSIFATNGAAGASGTIDGLATQPRDVQFALKVIW